VHQFSELSATFLISFCSDFVEDLSGKTGFSKVAGKSQS